MKKDLLKTVGESLGLRVDGINRVTGDGRPMGRFISELLDMAENRDGVYGPNNLPVSKEMTVRDLLDWHSDYDWKISDNQLANNQ